MTSRAAALAALIFLTTACGGATPTASRPTPAHTPVSAPPPVALPAPSAHPSYPPAGLADLVALAQQGTSRRFLGAEGQNLGMCSRGWERIYEPGATPAQQEAADLMRFAMSKQLLTRSCGGMVFGTTNDTYCNCYHGENGYLEIDRGPAQEPAPGMMQVLFETVEGQTSPGDWKITVEAPSE